MAAIFISHATSDAARAAQLLALLNDRGFSSVFLAFDTDRGVRPGDEWERRIYREIRCCQAVIVLVSAASVASEWCAFEVRQARALKKKIFPVKLGPCDSSVLADVQFVQLGDAGLDDRGGYEPLFSALDEATVARGTWDRDRPPYPGLLSFDERDAAVFFGRSSSIRAGIARLADQHEKRAPRWLVWLGASGSGKSSLLRAGMVPRIREDSAKRWIVVGPLRSGKNAVDSLALAFVDSFQRAGLKEDAQAIRATLRSGSPERWAELARELRFAWNTPDASVLIVVDQFEELLMLGPSAAEDNSGAELLSLLRAMSELKAATFLIAITLRADFLGSFQTNGDLRGISSEEIVVKPIADAELADVIRGPAMLAGITFDDDLVDKLVDDTKAGDALPLLAFVLRELYEKYGQGGLIEKREYTEGLGGMQSAIARRADDVLRAVTGSGARADLEQTLRRTFLSLVQLSDQGRPARRRKSWSDLPEDVHANVEEFVKARLLVSSFDQGHRQLEVAHEAIFHSWPTYERWIRESNAFLAWRKRLDPLSEHWSSKTTRGDADLLHSPELEEAALWLSKERGLLSSVETAFIEASARAQRRHKIAIRAAVTAAFAILAGVGGLARWQAGRANMAAASAHRLATFVTGSQSADPTLRTVILREIPPPVPAGWRGTAGAVAESVLDGHGQQTLSIAFSPDGTRVVMGAADHTARIWRLDGSGTCVELKAPRGAIDAVAFSPDGTKVVTGSDDNLARIWNADGKGGPIELKGHTEPIKAVAFSEDGRMVATGSEDKSARIWSVGGGSALAVLRGHLETVESVSFGNAGRDVRLVTGSDDGTARLWDLRGTSLITLSHGNTWVLSVAFSPDGRKVLTGSSDKTARIWDLDNPKTPLLLPGHTGLIPSVAFSPRGDKVLTGSSDKTARLWNVDGSDSIELKGQTGLIWSVAFSSDGTRVYTGSTDGTARTWRVQEPESPLKLRGHHGWVTSVAFSSDGTKLVMGSDDGTAEIRIADGGEPGIPLADPRMKKVTSVAFGPNGSAGANVATGHEDGSVTIWDTGGRPLRRLPGHAGEAQIDSVAFNHDGSRVLAGSQDKTARIWRLNEPGDPIVLRGHEKAVWAVAFTANDLVITGSEDDTVRIWTANGSEQLLNQSTESAGINSVASSPDGSHFAFGSRDGTAQVWTIDGQQRIRLRGHDGAVWGVAFSPDGRKVATASADNTARIWRSDGAGPPLELEGHLDHVTSVAFAPDGQKVLTGSRDGTARIWALDVRTVMWRQTSDCLKPDRRVGLLNEKVDDAARAYDRCLQVVEQCQVNFETCHKRVVAEFGDDLN